MAVNDLTFNQLSTVLNGIAAQATGTSPITPTNTAEFVNENIAKLALMQETADDILPQFIRV